MRADKYANEDQRLKVLAEYGILDTDPEASFDEITRLVAKLCNAPISVINLIDESRQWFKSEVGLGVRELPLDDSICAHAILETEMLVVPDTLLDPRFTDNQLVIGEPHLRFYAGALLRTSEGYPLGTLCVLDYVPRNLTDEQRNLISVLANQVMRNLDLRRAMIKQDALNKALQETNNLYQLLVDGAEEYGQILLTLDGSIMHWNKGASRIFRHGEEDVIGSNIELIFTPEDRADNVPQGELLRAIQDGRAEDRRWHLRRDGSRFWANGVMTLLRDESGEPQALTKVFRDETGRKKIEDVNAEMLKRESRIASSLQSALLMTSAEVDFPGLDISTFYEAAEDESLIGGDFYDVFATDETQVAVIVGDVVGKGLKAAMHTAKIKYTLRAYLREYSEPNVALQRLNSYLYQAQRLKGAHEDFDLSVVISIAIFDNPSKTVKISVAGAEPPLLVRTDGTSESLQARGSVLGFFPNSKFEAVTRKIDTDEMLIMVTDGITEARSGARFLEYEGMAELARAAAHFSELKAITSAIVEGARSFAKGRFHDDICLAIIRPTAK